MEFRWNRLRCTYIYVYTRVHDVSKKMILTRDENSRIPQCPISNFNSTMIIGILLMQGGNENDKKKLDRDRDFLNQKLYISVLSRKEW